MIRWRRQVKGGSGKGSLWLRFKHRWLPKNVVAYVSVEGLILVWNTPQGYPLRCGAWTFRAADADGQRNEVWSAVEVLRVKRVVGKAVQELGPMLVDPLLSKTHPTLHSFLVDTYWEEDGARTSRSPGSLIIWADLGQWKVKMLDRDQGQSILLAAPQWSRMMDLCEAVLCDPTAIWRPEAVPGKKPKR